MTFGKRLEECRKRVLMDQDEFADSIGVTRAAVSHYECDRRQPSLETLVAMSDVLGVTTDYLLKGI